MKTQEPTKVPRTGIAVYYITAGTPTWIVCQPDGETVSIGDMTYHVSPAALFFDRKKKMPCCIIREGIAEAIPIHEIGEGGLGAKAYDSAAHTDLLRQLHSLARDDQAKKGNMALYVGLGCLAVLIIGCTVYVHGEVIKVERELAAQAALSSQGTGIGQDGAVHPNTQQPSPPSGHLNGVPNSPGGNGG